MDSVSDELRVLSNKKSSIKFTTVYPFFVHTGFIKNIYFRFPWLIRKLSPQEVALSIINAQRQNRKNQIIPSYWLSICNLARQLPNIVEKYIQDFLLNFLFNIKSDD